MAGHIFQNPWNRARCDDHRVTAKLSHVPDRFAQMDFDILHFHLPPVPGKQIPQLVFVRFRACRNECTAKDIALFMDDRFMAS